MMNEENVNKETNQQYNKLDWEAPKLYCLDKGRTEGGSLSPGAEDTVYYS